MESIEYNKKIIINKKKEANDLKKEASNDDKIAKIETNSSDAKWSQYQGSLNWSRAKEKCASLGMRLPTVTELKSAYTAGVIESWKKMILGIGRLSFTMKIQHTVSVSPMVESSIKSIMLVECGAFDESFINWWYERFPFTLYP